MTEVEMLKARIAELEAERLEQDRQVEYLTKWVENLGGIQECPSGCGILKVNVPE